MYVCLCKAVTDRQIRETISEGATTFAEIRRQLGGYPMWQVLPASQIDRGNRRQQTAVYPRQLTRRNCPVGGCKHKQ